MFDHEPRPMPAEVRAAYRHPVDLLGLLESEAYPEDSQRFVRDGLLELLVSDLGNIWFPHGKTQTRSLEQRVKAIRSPVRSIGFMLDVDDYGGREITLRYLAMAMETRWSLWWDLFSWSGPSSLDAWRLVTSHVLGGRQYIWIAAQCARKVLHRVREEDAGIALESIESAEAYATSPTEDNARRSELAANASRFAYGRRMEEAMLCASRASAAVASQDPSVNAVAAVSSARFALDSVRWSDGYRTLINMTRQLFAPSLLDVRDL